MAEALVTIAVEVGQRLIDVVGQQLSLFAGATRELENLSSTFETIRAFLDDAESRQVGERPVRLWLSRLRHAAYDFEDLLMDASNHALSRYNVPRRIKDRYNVAHRIKGIKERLDQIDAERNRLGFSSSPVGGDHRMLVRNPRLTTSLKDDTEMVIGRENDKETIISRLVSESSSHVADGSQVHVVAIAGIGGLGKTTLARLIYHAREVQGHFNEAVYWVCVSDDFDVIRLIKAILEQVKGTNNFPSEPDALQKELLEALREKRFLLVLDDVWNDYAEKWETLRRPLTSGAHGSRILVTTRSERVANIMKASYIHELKGLSEDHSWRLFSSKAFDGWREGECSEFESTGKEIVNKCKGVPLSIKVIGSAMNTKSTVEDWKNILESKIWSLPEATVGILPVLLLTYCHLPPRLKQCFVYCSMFPKDWDFEKDMLIRLWVAQGFIPSMGNREEEDIGEEYFNDLVARSMFQEIKENYEGKIICKMHGLLHDLAAFIAEEEIYTFISKSKGGKLEECPGSRSNVRYAFLSLADCDDKPNKIPISDRRANKLRTFWLHGINKSDSGIIDLIHQARFLRALYLSSSTRLPKSIDKLKHLRYLHLRGLKMVKLPNAIVKLKHLRYLHLPYSEIAELPDAIGKMKQLRVLHLPNSKIVKLPNAIGKLKQLRYLDLSHNSNIVELPESVSDLRNLNTLNLSRCKKLEKLPMGIGRMVSLRHLEIEGTDGLKYLPKGLGGISGLRNLSKFTMGGVDEGEGCGINELQPLNSLQGTLQIQHLELSNQEEAEKAELWNKQYLNRLVLEMEYTNDDDDAMIETIDSVLEGLRPSENLEELQLIRLNGSKLPSWMDTMPCLQKLVLDSGLKLDRVPHLPSLKEFKIEGVRNEQLPDEGWEQLLALQKLRIYYCEDLMCLPQGLTQLLSLELLDIFSCYKLASMPGGLGQLEKLNSLHVSGSDVLTHLPDSLGRLKSLESLYISSCLNLESLPGLSGELEETEQSDGSFLSVPRGGRSLKKLNLLHVSGSEVLRCLPDSLGQLESLEYLVISDLKILESLPVSLGQLKKLKSLEVGRSEVLMCLPDSVGQLESLEHLYIYDLKKLESLPNSLGQLKALIRLEIRDCKALASLPQGLRRLSLLQELIIYNCPLVSETCKRKGGVDWPNIAHIPNITIDGRVLQGRKNPDKE